MIASFSSLAAAFAAYPNCIGIQLHEYIYHSLVIEYRLALAGPDNIYFQDITILSTDQDLLEQEIMSQKHWQVLVLLMRGSVGYLTRRIAPQIGVFKNLKELTIEFGYPEYPTFPVCLNGLPRLEKLFIQEVTVEINEPLTQVKSFSLKRGKLSQLEELMSFLNPDVLTYLAIQETTLTELPESLIRFTQLEVLNLGENEIKVLPEGIMQMEKLKNIYLFNNPVKYANELKESVLVKVIQQSVKRKLSQPVRTTYLNLLQNNLKDPQVILTEDLLRALEFDLLNERAMPLLEKRITSPFQKGADLSKQQVSVLGRMKGYSSEEIIEQFKRNNIQATDRLTPQTTLVCIGEQLTQKQTEEIVKRKLPVALPIHVRDFLQQLEVPYLVESEDSVHQNLLRLINSLDEDNSKLAAQIMLAGGIPEPLLYPVLLLNALRGKGYSTHFKKVLEKYLPHEQYEVIKKQQKAGFYKTVDELFKNPLFSAIETARAGLSLFALDEHTRRKGSTDHNFYRQFHYIVKRCFVAGGDPARMAYQAQLEGTTLNVLFFDDSFFGKFKLPVEILEFEQIERIICAQSVINEVATNQKTLKKMKNLKELTLFHFTGNSSNYLDVKYLKKLEADVVLLKQSFPHVQITLQTY
ncbi:leucine-rich repeat domain-containing protein [Cytophagaceae bacterium DM2B3-1]|uniref:Leucine-rich repeat domain-containing protein n=1 Tax=Xanthocytophaga flava TaxID=3048013 RepID=A0ABT7CM83_9BACT|nr:leucine-rich repeat domain-containing protein [Xanthocytophaga flavus]MDJ1494105.1 leucine-rich repeat domain-containing protein [Xanthocytophaga flavus]